MTETRTTPQAWIGCLSSYNAGRLIGEWVDATDADEMYEAQKRVAATAVKAAKEAKEYPVYFGEPEEFFIADYDGFGDLASTLGEYPSYETVARIGALIEEHGEAFIGFIDTCEPDLESVDEDAFHEAYRGEWDSEEAFSMDQATELGLGGIQAHWPKPTQYGYSHDEHINVIEALENYIDWEKVAREDFRHGPMASRPASGGGIYVYDTER
jgi:antirestriction protein